MCHEVIVGSASTFVDLQIIDLNRFNCVTHIIKPGIPYLTQQESEIELNSIPELLVNAPNSTELTSYQRYYILCTIKDESSLISWEALFQYLKSTD